MLMITMLITIHNADKQGENDNEVIVQYEAHKNLLKELPDDDEDFTQQEQEQEEQEQEEKEEKEQLGTSWEEERTIKEMERRRIA